MTVQITSGPGWDASQWASTKRTAPVEDVRKWTLWQWASAPRRAYKSLVAPADSALSGGGHNSSGQRWTVGYSATS